MLKTQWFNASGGLVTGFIAVTALCVTLWLALVLYGALKTQKVFAFTGFGLGLSLWMGAGLALADRGFFLDFSLPPRLLIAVVVGLVALTLVTHKSSFRQVVDAVPLGAWVVFQAYRLPLEIVMHGAAAEGVMPPQMSYSGYNFDIVTGATALVLGTWMLSAELTGKLKAPPRALVLGWNILGSALLLIVVCIAAASFPSPMRLFMNEPANVWVGMPPFVLLPLVMVLGAAWTHLQVFRRLQVPAPKEVITSAP